MTNISAMEIGRAAEYLVVADLIIQGVPAFLSDQGLPFDVVADVKGRLVRIQVKACQQAKNCSAAGRAKRIAYTWAVRRRGKAGKGERLSDRHCDLVALVALDLRLVGYLPIEICGQTVQIEPPNSVRSVENQGATGWGASIDAFTFDRAMNGDAIKSYQEMKKPFIERTHCRWGHPYDESNRYYRKDGKFNCKTCCLNGIRKRKIRCVS